MRLVFMGTPEAAVPTLRRCVEAGHEVVAVWTQPDRPAGRGNKLTTPPVKQYALAQGIPVHQPTKIKTVEAHELFASHAADVAVVVAYGRILPPSFLAAPRLGCVNVHFSLLPKYRGAAPVNWALVRGERETGVTTMLMDDGLDTGPVLLQRATKIGEGETAPELLARLSDTGAKLLGETLARLAEIEPRAQRHEEASLAPVLRREDGLIDWSTSAPEIERRVRGFQPWPGAYTSHEQRRLVVWLAEVAGQGTHGVANHVLGREVDSILSVEEAGRAVVNGETFGPGAVIEARGESLTVACGEGSALRLIEVQAEGKRRMSARDFLNGTRLQMGETLGATPAGGAEKSA